MSIPDEEPSSVFFLEAIFPPAHLVIAGAGHIGKALAHLADMLDFEVTVIDDRHEYANSENIPEADHIIVNDIGEALSRLEKNRNTYVVIVTRGHKDDANALHACIGIRSGIYRNDRKQEKNFCYAIRVYRKWMGNSWAVG